MQLGHKRNRYCEINIFIHQDHEQSNLTHSLLICFEFEHKLCKLLL